MPNRPSERQRSRVMMMDADHLKQVNDTYGHIAGDAVSEKATIAAADSALCEAKRLAQNRAKLRSGRHFNFQGIL